jgi:hypothetical protein
VCGGSVAYISWASTSSETHGFATFESNSSGPFIGIRKFKDKPEHFFAKLMNVPRWTRNTQGEV